MVGIQPREEADKDKQMQGCQGIPQKKTDRASKANAGQAHQAKAKEAGAIQKPTQGRDNFLPKQTNSRVAHLKFLCPTKQKRDKNKNKTKLQANAYRPAQAQD